MDVKTEALLSRAAIRLDTAHRILQQLQLFPRWQQFGTPILVGAVAYELVVAPDIDLEVFCEDVRIEDGFEVLRGCALHPQVREVRFANHLQGPDQGLYWRVLYQQEDGRLWKLDMWSLHRSHPGPYAAGLVEPMRQALTPQLRTAILSLKEQIHEQQLSCPSIALYEAVFDAGVRTLADLTAWLADRDVKQLSTWRPKHGSL